MRKLTIIQDYGQEGISEVMGRGTGNDLDGVMWIIVGFFVCLFIYGAMSDYNNKNK